MVPLPVGGRDGCCRRPAGALVSGPVSATRIGARAAALLLAAPALLWAPTAASAGEGDLVLRGQGRGEALTMIVAPMAVQAPARDADWTSRAPAATRIADGRETAAERRAAHVRMFSWREILFYGVVVVVAIGGLLAFTGGHGRAQRHH